MNASPRALIEQSFPPIPAAAGAARVVVEAGTANLPPDLVDTLVLLVSELITNSVRHGRGEFFHQPVHVLPLDELHHAISALAVLLVVGAAIAIEPTHPMKGRRAR